MNNINTKNISQKITSALAVMGGTVEMVKVGTGHLWRRKLDGKKLAGVSTISKMLPDDGWRVPYGSKCAVKALGYFDQIIGKDHAEDWERLEKILSKVKTADKTKFYDMLVEAKKSQKDALEEAADLGKDGHEWCEKYVLACIAGEKKPAIPSGDLERPLTQFVKWAEENVDYWIASEGAVCDMDHDFAGQFDAIAMMKTGRLALIDFKFANFIDKAYYLQTAGYCIPFEKFDIKFDERRILRFPKTLKIAEWDKKSHGYREVVNDFEDHLVPTDYSFDCETFLRLREVERWKNQQILNKK